MPSFTFIASGHAVCNAGYEPFLVDIDERSFVITPAIAAAALRSMLESPAAVLVISAFGAPPDVPAWQAFEHDHGIPVIFDAAATIAHDCELEDFATLASGVALAGGVHLGSGVEIGTGARVAPRIRIDQDAVVGTGAMVIRPVPRAVTVPGVPARALRPDRRNSGLNPSVIDRKE